MQQVISYDPAVLGGTPVFIGTRVPVRNLIDYIEQGKTINEFIEDFPSVSKEQITAFLEQASASVIRLAA
jgi:uncharacterized protein (DUF433 family)